MKKKAFGRRKIEAGRAMQAISPDQPASDAAARQKLLDDLAEQARSGGQKEQAEFEAELKAWKNASMVAHANPYD